MARNVAPDNGATCAHVAAARSCKAASAGRRPDPSGGAEERPALDPARAIRNRVEQKGLGERVERLQPFRRSVRVVHQRQRGIARLLDGCLEKDAERVESVHLALLPCGLEAPGVRKRTRRECGIDDLPRQPVGHYQVANVGHLQALTQIRLKPDYSSLLRTESTAARAAARRPALRAVLRRRP